MSLFVEQEQRHRCGAWTCRPGGGGRGLDEPKNKASHTWTASVKVPHTVGSSARRSATWWGAGRGGAGGSIRTEGYVYTVYSGCMAETNTTLQSIYPPVKSQFKNIRKMENFLKLGSLGWGLLTNIFNKKSDKL